MKRAISVAALLLCLLVCAASAQIGGNGIERFTGVANPASAVENNADLMGLSTATAQAVARLGYYTAGDAPQLTFVPSSSPCSLASFTATISNTTLTVFGSATGTIAVGQFLQSPFVQAGTKIISGAGASWTISIPQTVSTRVRMAIGDGGAQVPSADGNCWIAAFNSSNDTITEWGATISADIMPYLKLAWMANTGLCTKIPAGIWPVESAQTFVLGGAPGGLPPPCFYGDQWAWHGDSSSPPIAEYMTGTWLHWPSAYDSIGTPFNIVGTAPANNVNGDTSYGTASGFTVIGFYNDQPPPVSGYVPDKNYSYWFNLANFYHTNFDQLMFLNATHCITSSLVGRLQIGTIYGQPLGTCLNVTQAYDVARWSYIDFWPFWTTNANVLSYTRANIKPISTTSALYADTIFDISYYAGLYSTTQAASALTASIAGNIASVSAVGSGSVTPGQYITGTGVLVPQMVVDYDGGSGSTGTYYVSNAQTLASAAITGVVSDIPLGGQIKLLYADETCRGFWNDAATATWDITQFQSDGYNQGTGTWVSGCDSIYLNSHDARIAIDNLYEDQAPSSIYHDAGAGSGVNGNYTAIGTVRFSNNVVGWGLSNDGSDAFNIANHSGSASSGILQVSNFLGAGIQGCTSSNTPLLCTGTNPYTFTNTSTNGIYDVSGLSIPWTPILNFGSGGSATYTSYGLYTQDVNGFITATLGFTVSSVSGSPSGGITITGLPATCSGGVARQGGMGAIPYSVNFTGLTGAMFLDLGLGGSSTINVYQSGSTGSVGSAVAGANLTSTSELVGSVQCNGLP